MISYIYLYGLNKVFIDNVIVHHVQEVVDVIESPHLIFYSPDLFHNMGGIQKAKNIMCNYEVVLTVAFGMV